MSLLRPRLIFLLSLIFLCSTCGGSGTSPGPVTTTTTVEIEPPRPPRVDFQPDLWNIRGCTTFGAATLTEPELITLISHLQAGGCRIMRTGAQTDGWRGIGVSYLEASVGPVVFSTEWEENLKLFLDTTARMGIAVQLIPTFTHKHEGLARNLEITKAVVAIQQAGSTDDPRPFEHIVWEAVNEWKHPVSSLSMSDVAELLRYLSSATGLPVGANASGGRRGKWIGEYPSELLPLVDYVAFHPPRVNMDGGGCESVRPDYWQLRRTVNSYSKPVWIDEPLCFISDYSKDHYGIERSGHYALCAGGTEDGRKRVILDYKWDVEAVGGIWFTHTLWGFPCTRPGWLAQ